MATKKMFDSLCEKIRFADILDFNQELHSLQLFDGKCVGKKFQLLSNFD